jgi:nitrogen fixation protein NifB
VTTEHTISEKVDVDGATVAYDPTQLRQIREHPCYSEGASHKYGRAHLAVAPECNVQCNYCVRKFDCVNESRPGVASEVLSPERALELARTIVSEHQNIHVIGIAGPGDPLANEATFETLRLIHDEYPDLIFCISTNGLLLPDSVDRLADLGVTNLTVTLNALDPGVCAKIYQYIDYKGKRYYSSAEMADILTNAQLTGIEAAVKKGMLVKVNTVYIPNINGEEIPRIAEKAAELGAFNQNIIPLIAQAKFATLSPPTFAEKEAMQKRCSVFIKQMSHCQRCRADAVGCLGKDLKLGGCSRSAS